MSLEEKEDSICTVCLDPLNLEQADKAQGKTDPAEPHQIPDKQTPEQPDQFQSITQLGCGHKFHVRCVIDWFNKSPGIDTICPTCKQPAVKILIKKRNMQIWAAIEKLEGEFDFPEDFLTPAQINHLESSHKLIIYKNKTQAEESEEMIEDDIEIIEDSDSSDVQIEIPSMLTFRIPTGFRAPQVNQNRNIDQDSPYTRPLSCAICDQYAQSPLSYKCRSCKANYHLGCLKEASKNHNWERRACRICLPEVLIASYLLRSPFSEMSQSFSTNVPKRVKMNLLGQFQRFLLEMYSNHSTQTLPHIIFHGNLIINKNTNSTREIRANESYYKERFLNGTPRSTTDIEEIH